MTLSNFNSEEIKLKSTFLLGPKKQNKLPSASKTKEKLLTQLYPSGTAFKMIVQVGNERFKFIKGQWLQLPQGYQSNLTEILRIPLSKKVTSLLRTLVSNKVNLLLDNPMGFNSASVARKIAREALPETVIEELEKLLWDCSEYVSVVIDNLFSGWLDFDVNNSYHQKVALAMKYVILSCLGEFRTKNECLRLVLTMPGHEGKNGSRGSEVVFYEHTDGVHFTPWEEPDLLCLMGLSQPQDSPNTFISPVVEAISHMRPDYIEILSDKSNYEVTPPPSDKSRHQKVWSPIQVVFGREQAKLIRLDTDLIRARTAKGYLALGSLQQALINVRIPIQLTPGSLLLHRNNLGSHARGRNKADFNMPDLKNRRVFSRSYLINLRSNKKT